MKPQNRPSPERLLMTGASGLLGSALVPEAHQRGYAVTAVTHTFAGVFPYGESRKCDISRYDTLSPFLDSMNPSLILHCAALTDVDFCEMNPDRANAINREATSRLAQWAGQHNSYFVYISTDSVFDGKHGSYAENDVPRPLNWYARTKWEGEQAVRTHTPRHLIVR